MRALYRFLRKVSARTAIALRAAISCLVSRASRRSEKVPVNVPEKIVVPDKIPFNFGKSASNGPMYRVVLWNDEYNSMDHVITILIRVIDSMDLQSAIAVMTTAHQKGTAVVVESPQEKAEHYRQQLEHGGLTATTEPVG